MSTATAPVVHFTGELTATSNGVPHISWGHYNKGIKILGGYYAKAAYNIKSIDNFYVAVTWFPNLKNPVSNVAKVSSNLDECEKEVKRLKKDPRFINGAMAITIVQPTQLLRRA